ncbi:hypothetical protein TNCV_3229041 [Trichonephila clavipes]|nr:hypothetical protein TNCV_3229041 [Trichonephila clavipes]
MDDNATCHRTLAVQDCLDSEGYQRLVWPSRSPDLNPIENVWDALGRQVAGRNYPPTNKNTLIPVNPKCLGGPPVDHDRRNAQPGHKLSVSENEMISEGSISLEVIISLTAKFQLRRKS